MNFIEIFQNLVVQVFELVQLLIVVLVGVVFFVEGEGVVSIGIIGGIVLVVVVIVVMVGNFLCVMVLVLVSFGVCVVVVNCLWVKQVVFVGGGIGIEMEFVLDVGCGSVCWEKFQCVFECYGVFGVSFFGFLLLLMQFIVIMFVVLGIGKGCIFFWQVFVIIGWMIIVVFIVGSVVYVIS